MPMISEEGAWTTMTAVHPERISHKRRLVSTMVSNDALRAFEPCETLYLDTSCRIIGGETGANGWSSPKDMTVECEDLRFQLVTLSSPLIGRKFMIDMMSDFAYGQKINVMTTPELHFILDALGNYAWRMGIYKESPSLTRLQLERILGFVRRNSQSRKWAQWGADYTSAILDDPDKNKRGRFSFFQNSIDPITKAAISRAELSAEGFFLLLAGLALSEDPRKCEPAYNLLGSESSATTASAAFFYLAHDREAYYKVANEIRTTFAAADDIRSGMALSSCSYLHACITETLRLSPATVGAPWRDVRQAGYSINGELIPVNCEVGTYVYPSVRDKLT